MTVILNIGVFALIIGCSFVVGSMFAAKYILYLLHEEGYSKTKEADV